MTNVNQFYIKVRLLQEKYLNNLKYEFGLLQIHFSIQ
jgi:hypothetical protein